MLQLRAPGSVAIGLFVVPVYLAGQTSHYALNSKGTPQKLKKVAYLIIEFLAMNKTNGE